MTPPRPSLAARFQRWLASPRVLVVLPLLAVLLGLPALAGGLALDERGRPIVPDAGPPPPIPLEPDAALPAEAPSTRDLSGVTLEATWRWRDVPPPPRAPEVSAEGIKAEPTPYSPWGLRVHGKPHLVVPYSLATNDAKLVGGPLVTGRSLNLAVSTAMAIGEATRQVE